MLPDHLDQLRLAAALAHSAVDADVEIVGPGRRWLVSYGRPEAAIDPCGLRQLVLAARRGCRSPLLPAESIRFVGGLREIGGGVYERRGPDGLERRMASRPITAEAMVSARPDAVVVTTTGLESVGGVDGLLEIAAIGRAPAGQNRRVLAYEDQYPYGFGPRTGQLLADLGRELQSTKRST